MLITDASQIVILDANESAFFLRELEHVKAKTYDTKYKHLKATTLLPVDTSADSGAKEITYQSYTKVGIAKIIADYADDAPRVDIYGTETTVKVYRVGDSYGYDRDEIRRSAMAGKSLDQRRANTAKRASDEKVDAIAWSGDTDYNIQGFITYPGITQYIVPNGVAGTATWATKTPDEIITDLNGIVDAVIDGTNGVEMPDTILMPIAQYRLISTTRMTGNSDETILSFFKKTNELVTTIDWLTELNAGGAGGLDRFMTYPKDPDHVTLEIPLPYTTLPPEQRNYGFVINTETKTAGVIVYYPLAIAYGDGI